MATPTLVQHISSANTGPQDAGYLHVGLPNKTLASNALILSFQTDTATGIDGVTDNQGNTWSQVVTVTGGQKGYVYACFGATAGVTEVRVRFKSALANYLSFEFTEFYNVATSSAVSGTPIGASGSGTAWQSGSVTPGVGGCLIYQVGFTTDNPTPNVASFANDTNFNLLSANRTSGQAAQYWVQGSAAAINPTLTCGSSHGFVSMTFALVSAAAGTAPTGVYVRRQQDEIANSSTAQAAQFPASGTVILLRWDGYNGTATTHCKVSAISDSNGNTWNDRCTASQNTSNNPANAFMDQQMLDVINPTVSNNLQISITLDHTSGGSTYRLYDIVSDNASPFDTTATNVGYDATNQSYNTVALTPGAAGALVIMGLNQDAGTMQGLDHGGSSNIAHDVASESHTGTTGSTSQASFSWTHTPVGTPKGVLVFTFVNANADNATSVTYGGTTVPAVTNGRSVDTAGEPGDCKAWFLGSGIGTGAKTVVVNRTNNTNVMYAVAITVTADGNTMLAGLPIRFEQDQALVLSGHSIVPGGIDSGKGVALRYAGLNSGLPSPGPADGASSVSLQSIDFGARIISVLRGTKGSGTQQIGWSSGALDDVAAIIVAITDSTAGNLYDTNAIFCTPWINSTSGGFTWNEDRADAVYHAPDTSAYTFKVNGNQSPGAWCAAAISYLPAAAGSAVSATHIGSIESRGAMVNAKNAAIEAKAPALAARNYLLESIASVNHLSILNLEGLANAIGARIPSIEATAGLTMIRSELFESSSLISTTHNGNIESLAALKIAINKNVESLAAAIGALVINLESQGAAVHIPLDVFDIPGVYFAPYPISLLSVIDDYIIAGVLLPVTNSITESIESLQRLAASTSASLETKTIATMVYNLTIESLTNPAHLSSVNLDILANAAGTRTQGLESLGRLLITVTDTIESLAMLAASCAARMESLNLLSVSRALNIESLGQATVAVTAIIPIEARGNLYVPAAANIENRQGLTRSIIIGIESLFSVSKNINGTVEILAGISLQKSINIESLAATIAVAGSAVLSVECLRKISELTQIPIEALRASGINVIVNVVERTAYFQICHDATAQFSATHDIEAIF